jgi:putative inorganic carbon (hco3(-)) transporter
MSKLLFLWLVVYFGGLILAVVHPIYPMVSYLLFYYAPPHANWWGRNLPDLRYSLLASAFIIFALVLKNGVLERLKSVKNPALPWLLLFGVNVSLVTVWAISRYRSWHWASAILKLIVLYMLIPATVRTPAHFDMFSAVHIGGATYWGYKAWDDPVRSRGRLKDVGGTDTQNENQAAAHLLTVLPFVAIYAFTVKRRWLQGVILVCGASIVNVFILCNSRGATLGFLVMGAAAIILAGKGRRIKLVGIGAAGVITLFALADNRFIERQQTTAEHQDGSSQGRLRAWRAGLEVIKDYPFGGGGRAFHILSPKYIPETVERHGGEERSVHNTFLQLGAEWGIQGIILWCGFLGATFYQSMRARAQAKGEPWFYYRYLAIELGLLGTLFAGIFGQRLYGESVYWLCALIVSLRRMHATAIDPAFAEQPAQSQQPESPTVAAATRQATAN